jgi:ABC-2 type transport system ATP-binding protein
MPRPAPASTRSVTKRFGAVVAVDTVTLSLRRGEVFGLLGPNGAGKTTTLRMLMGFLRPTTGEVRVLGGDPFDTRVRARVGYVGAEARFNPRHTGAEWLQFCADIRGGDKGRTDELVERLEIETSRPIGHLSTGNKHKISIAAAFAHSPDLFVLDEPTAGLDPLLQRTFRELVGEATSGGATVLLSSHILPEVETLADRVGLIRQGKLATVSDIDELRRHARQRFDFKFAKRASLPSLRKIPGVVAVQELDGVVGVTLEGSPGPLLKAAARLDVQRMTTHEADLDELFFSMYEGSS